MPTPHIILDFDGTLIDSSPAILETMRAVLRARDIPVIRPLERDVIGPPLTSTLQTLTGLTDKQVLEALAADFRSRYDTEGLHATQAYPGIAGVLGQLLASGHHLHLATNKRLLPTELLLKHLGWAAWFSAVYCVDSRMPPYPRKGEMLRALLKDRELDPEECVYVGDTRYDQQSAEQAGLRFVGVGWGYGVGEQAFDDGVELLRSPEDLLGIA